MYKAAIFDLDGTVADTLTGITHFVNRATAHFGLSSVSSEKIKYYVGDGAAVLIERVLSDVGGIEQKQQILEYYNALYNGDPYYKLKAFPGIPEMLDSLKQKGIKLAVLSNKPHTATAPICERLFHGRFDIVQGHVDQTATCTAVESADGSYYYTFEYEQHGDNVTVEKGSVAVNGVSLTVVNSRSGSFQVAIIPYTHEHTNFKDIRPGSVVNIEFDIIGKYIARLMKGYTEGR